MPRRGVSLDGARTIEKMSAERSIHFSNGFSAFRCVPLTLHTAPLTPPVKFYLTSFSKTQSAIADGSCCLPV